ncbi:hypothetical protein P3T27_002814 [Kitasatospora sp. MAA19]|uniref:hypothetical protein n=1 Tax=Kitasatospora sp. MAA19 TaxID=3035090 RepID=UPI0024745FC6|nr:hypothetical protein [Kitasatospora sp. MAA19]MDH6706091.1 hypothetical protein [Kitasatospora sp. MAA19]
MRVHRSAHVRNFTVLPNAALQCRRLSYTARGLLADLLSRPDGWREDGRHMADTSPQGRGAIRKALKELTAAGFYRVEKIRMPDGTIRSEAHVYDTPQRSAPSAAPPAPGEAATGAAGGPVVKNRQEGTSLPANPAGGKDPGGGEGTPGNARTSTAVPDEEVREAVATLFRVIRPEPRLRLGQAEAQELAPLVAQWLERGSTQADLAQALLPGLPVPVHSAAAVLRYRLEHKMPPSRPQERPPEARYSECAKCHDPVPRPGICRACAGLGRRTVAVGGGASVAARGAARARAALLSAGAPFPGSRPGSHPGSRPGEAIAH